MSNPQLPSLSNWRNPMPIDLRNPAGNGGVETAFLDNAEPRDGVIFEEKLLTGPFTRACYFAQMQKYDVAKKGKDSWPNGANRIQPLAVEDFTSLRRGGMFLLVAREAGNFLAALPLTGKGSMAWLESADGELVLKAGNLGTGKLSGEIPLLSWAIGPDAYGACAAAWRQAIDHPLLDGAMRRRCDKQYPHLLEYLGWCSWEEYRKEIDEAVLLEAADGIEASALPVRYMLVDDGHLNHEDGQLIDFTVDAEKFAHGWEKLMARRDPQRIRWMGLWLNFNGYWDGISPKHRMPELSEDLQPVEYEQLQLGKTVRALLPADGARSSFAFYDGMISASRRAGFDFVKVDNQAGNLFKYRGTQQPVAKACENSQALEGACALHSDGLINCMAHNSVCVQNSRVSVVNRCSEDYAKGDLGRARRHLHNSYANMAWLGHTMWGDHDMFHSNDAVSGKMMAISKAVSGGPVYLSDNPKDFVAEHVRPLCYADGLLLRPLAPATATPESLLIDPFAQAKPFRAAAPLANGAAAVVVYNFTEPEQPVRGFVEPADHAHAGVLLQETPWPGFEEGFVLYDWHEKQLRAGQRFEFDLPGFADRLFFLCPIVHGWSLIGRIDKYLSPAAGHVLSAGADKLVLGYREAGQFLVHSRSGKPEALHNCTLSQVGEEMWSLQPGQEGPGVMIVGR
jgi:hypothetical protein